MQIIVDGKTREILPTSTLGAVLQSLQPELDSGVGTSLRIVVGVKLGDQTIDGAQLTARMAEPVGNACVEITTAVRDDLARTTIGKLAALVEYLGPRQHAVAALLENGQAPKALTELTGVLSAWQQVQQTFEGLTTLLKIDLNRQLVGTRPAADLLDEFRTQLEEVGKALQVQDMVLLGDVLQYEMDTGITHWNDILATLLGIVDGVVEQAA